MDLTKAGSLLPSVPSIGGIGNGPGAAGTPGGAQNNVFSDMLKNIVQSTTTAQNEAQQLSLAAAQGADVPLNQVVQALSKAELSLQTLITVRDRAVEAYQQIVQMPI